MPPSTDQNEHRTNDRIRAREVRLIGPDGAQLGVKPLPEALSIARRLDLDLVEVASEANPPVCRIMDFNRFKYEAAQRAKESKRKSTSAGIKEMKYRPKIGVGDFDTKTRQVARFLGEGHKVKITIMFRGREMSHPDLGKKILDQVAEQVEGVGKVEAAPKLDGRNMIMVLAPERRPQTRKPVSAPGQALPADSASQAQAGTAASLDSPLADTGLLPDGAPAPQEEAGGANGVEVSNPVDAAYGGVAGRAGAANTAAGAS
ncbi:MAG: translation initiation factor IF-3 [Acidimicrobiales bacterium]